jgi:hypothetical protein
MISVELIACSVFEQVFGFAKSDSVCVCAYVKYVNTVYKSDTHQSFIEGKLRLELEPVRPRSPRSV